VCTLSVLRYCDTIWAVYVERDDDVALIEQARVNGTTAPCPEHRVCHAEPGIACLSATNVYAASLYWAVMSITSIGYTTSTSLHNHLHRFTPLHASMYTSMSMCAHNFTPPSMPPFTGTATLPRRRRTRASSSSPLR
jgi:hypothetical protein